MTLDHDSVSGCSLYPRLDKGTGFGPSFELEINSSCCFLKANTDPFFHFDLLFREQPCEITEQPDEITGQIRCCDPK